MERKHPQRGEVGVGVMPVEHERLDLRQAIRQQDLDSAPGPDGEEVQHLQRISEEYPGCDEANKAMRLLAQRVCTQLHYRGLPAW
jgi:hypothetical protein